jgi:hypothetical protein
MLTDAAIRKAEPKEKSYKLSDKRGLYLLVTPSGGKLWRMNYRFCGKQKTLAFGSYPDVSIAEAREGCKEAHKLRKGGIDPSMERKARKEEALRNAMERAEKEAAALRFEIADSGALLIAANGAKLLLNPSQAGALHAFLNAARLEPNEGEPPC